MRIEKEIKRQARASLHGNFTKLIAAAGLTVLALLLLENLEYLVLYLTGIVNTETDKVNDGCYWQYLLAAACFTAAVLLASPLLNGFLRMTVNTAVQKECASIDIFYYFRDFSLYFKTVLINMTLFIIVGVAASAVNISGYLELLAPDLAGEHPLAVSAQIVTVLLRVLLYLLFAHYPLFSYAFNENQSFTRCVFGSIRFSFRHFGQLLRLVCSFAGWFALCFFVVPAIYVLPYFAVAAATSARWLFQIESDGGRV